MKTINRRNFFKNGLLSTTGLVFTSSLGAAMAPVPGSGISAPDFNILDFGAVGDGRTLNTNAIQKAIDTCAEKGGGRVLVPKGIFLTGGIMLKSNVELHLEEHGALLGSPYMKDYPERALRTPARYSRYLRYALVFAQGVHNIAVTGKGTLDGNCFRGAELGEFANKGGTADQRPCLLWFEECENITMRDITFTRSAMWTETYSRCRNVHVDHITVKENYFFNADGCDIIDCEGFIVENCDINAQDDGICLKGYTNEGVRRGIIRNNRVRSICNGIKMGTDSSGGFRDILIENNEVWQTGISGLALEMTDGGTMENVTVRNITMNVVATPIFIMLSNRNREVYDSLTVPKGAIRDVYIGGIRAIVDKYETYHEEERKHFDLIPYASSITGFPENYVERVTIEDVEILIRGGFPEGTTDDVLREVPEAGRSYPENRMFGTLPSYAFYIRHARDLYMRNIRIQMEQEDGRPAFVLDDVHQSGFDDMAVDAVTHSPAFSAFPTCGGVRFDVRSAGTQAAGTGTDQK